MIKGGAMKIAKIIENPQELIRKVGTIATLEETKARKELVFENKAIITLENFIYMIMKSLLIFYPYLFDAPSEILVHFVKLQIENTLLKTIMFKEVIYAELEDGIDIAIHLSDYNINPIVGQDIGEYKKPKLDA